MNIPEPYRLYFPPIRQERYYGQLLSWTMDEGKRSFGTLVPEDIYAADNIQKVNGASYQIPENRKYAEPFAFRGNLNSSRSNASGDDDFDNVAGKGKLCRQAGLTGAEKKACKQSIKTKCGRKPRGFLGLKGARKRELQEKWSKCAQEMVVTPEEAARGLAEDIVPSSEKEGLSTGAKVMLGVAIVGTLTLIGFAVAAKMKKPQPVMAQAPIRPMVRR